MRLAVPVLGFSFLCAFVLVALLLALPMPVALLAGPAGLAVGVVLLRPYLGLWGLVFLIPLDGLTNALFASSPISAVKGLTLVTLAGFFLNQVTVSRDKRFGPDTVTWRCAVLFALMIVICAFGAEDLGYTFWASRRLLSLLVLLFLTIALVNTRERAEYLLLAVVGSTAISALILLCDSLLGLTLVSSSEAATTAQWEGVSRSSGTSDYDPTTAATMTLAGTAVALMYFLRSPRWRYLTGITVIVASLALMLSFARSAAVAYGLGICWLMFQYRHHRRFPLFLASSCILLVVGLAVNYVLDVLPVAEYVERLSTLLSFDSDYTLWRRLGYNLIGLELLAEHPFFGVGPGNFQYHYVDPEYRFIPGRTMLVRVAKSAHLSNSLWRGLLSLA